MPYLPIMAILSSAFLVINLPRLTMIRFVAWVAIGTVIYFAYSKKHSVLSQNEEL
jgi:APA family basic amino acid/polyamine antiporter